MWKIKKNPVPCNWLTFEPDNVLDEYDCPLLFTLKDEAGNKYLAYFCDRDETKVRFLVVIFSDRLETKLLGGDIDMREALIRPSMWFFDLDKNWNPVACWRIGLSDLPRNLIPRPGVMLRAEMQPVTKAAIVHSITGTTMVTHRFDTVEI